MSNEEVVTAFVRGTEGSAENLRSTGHVLVSYRTEIAKRIGDTIHVTAKKYSRTTSRHCSLTVRTAKAHGVSCVPYSEEV